MDDGIEDVNDNVKLVQWWDVQYDSVRSVQWWNQCNAAQQQQQGIGRNVELDHVAGTFYF